MKERSTSQTADLSSVADLVSSLNREKARFCLMLCAKGKKYLQNGTPPEKVLNNLKVDFHFYGGDKIFGASEVDTVIDGAYSNTMSDYELPE